LLAKYEEISLNTVCYKGIDILIKNYEPLTFIKIFYKIIYYLFNIGNYFKNNNSYT